MQMVPQHHHLTHNFWEKDTVSSKLPYLHGENTSRQRSASGTHHNYHENHERKMSSIRERQHLDSAHKKKHIHVEERNEYFPSWRESDKLFPLKPVLHKRAFSLSNVTKADRYSSTDQAIRHQQRPGRKLDPLNPHLTKSDADREHQISEKHSRLSKEIQSKEMMLQQKIFKVEETVRRVQKERNKRYFEKQKQDGLYYNEYTDWFKGRGRYENQRNGNLERWEEFGDELRKLDEYEYTAKDRHWEVDHGRMVLDDYDRRRRGMHLDIEDEDRQNVRQLNSSESLRRDRSHLKQDRRGDREVSSRRVNMKSVEGNARLEEDVDALHQLIPCNVCHRSFARERLEAHMRVCEKKRPQRKVFDMSQYRAKGTELEEFMKTNSRSKTPERKKNNWRQKHEAFIQNMRQGRSNTSGSEQHSLSSLHPEYVACPHCGRKFAPGPAERHIPKCQNIKSRPAPPRQQHSAPRRRTVH